MKKLSLDKDQYTKEEVVELIKKMFSETELELLINESMVGYVVNGTMNGCITKNEIPKLIKKIHEKI